MRTSAVPAARLPQWINRDPLLPTVTTSAAPLRGVILGDYILNYPLWSDPLKVVQIC